MVSALDLTFFAQRVIEGFEKALDAARAIVLEKTRFIEKTSAINAGLINELAFSPESGFVQVLKEDILETSACSALLENTTDPLHARYASMDLEDVIRDRFHEKTRNRIHWKVLEYLFKISLVLLADHPEELKKDEQALIPLLRFLDCVSWDNASTMDEQRGLSILRQPSVAALLEIGSTTSSLTVFSLVAQTLGAAISTRAWPQGSEAFQSKYPCNDSFSFGRTVPQVPCTRRSHSEDPRAGLDRGRDDCPAHQAGANALLR